MSIFSNTYANNYDLFYSSKNYKLESDYILETTAKYNVQPGNILDLGCGTGKHAIEWAKQGIHVKGVDQSAEMLSFAKESVLNLDNEVQDLISFDNTDIRNFEIEHSKYDLVTCMFAVLGYVTEIADLINLFKRISESLRPGGLFMCDTWHGNAVLSEKPSNRIHESDYENKKVFRIVKSELEPLRQIVNINYKVIEISDKTNVHEENHSMRYFFPDEMKLLAEISNMSLVKCSGFMSKKQLDPSDWNVSWVFLKKG